MANGQEPRALGIRQTVTVYVLLTALAAIPLNAVMKNWGRRIVLVSTLVAFIWPLCAGGRFGVVTLEAPGVAVLGRQMLGCWSRTGLIDSSSDARWRMVDSACQLAAS